MGTNGSASMITVLVADDEPPIRLLVRVNLEAEGYNVIEASNGEEALEQAQELMPDVILLDVMMPRKDGWTVAQELLGIPKTAQIPIVFLTARADLRDHERGLDAGALQYITKPFNPRDLAPTIEECLKTARAGESDSVRQERLSTIRKMQESVE